MPNPAHVLLPSPALFDVTTVEGKDPEGTSAAQASERLAGTDGFEALAPVRSLIVLLLDHEPAEDEVRRIQAQANRGEELALCDQQEQFRDCWQARAGLPGSDRMAIVCADLGISGRLCRELRLSALCPRRRRRSRLPAHHRTRRRRRRRSAVQRGDLGEALDRPARAVDADRRPPLTRLQRLDA